MKRRIRYAILIAVAFTGSLAHSQTLGAITLNGTGFNDAEKVQIGEALRREFPEILEGRSARDLLDPKSILTEDFSGALRIALQARGYFRPEVGPVTATLSADQSSVDVFARVQEGRLYRFGNLTLNDIRALPFQVQREAFDLHPGDVFDIRVIQAGVEKLKRQLCLYGYVNAKVEPEAHADEQLGTVAILLKIYDGGEFHVGRLTVIGPGASSDAGQKLLFAWKPLEGMPYSCGRNISFFVEQHRDLLPSNFDPLRDIRLEMSEANHLINFRLTLP